MRVVFAALFIAVGLLYIGLAIPLMRRRVKPNRLYGLRVPATFADEWVWYEANAQTGRDLIYVGTLQTGVAIVLALNKGVSDVQYAIGNAAVLFVGSISIAVLGWKRANRLLQERRGVL
jgi:hypothetical protein